MKFALHLLLLSSAIPAIQTCAMEPTKDSQKAALSFASIKAVLFHGQVMPPFFNPSPLDLASIHNMDATLKITGEDAQAKLAELANHLERLKSLAPLEIYWQTPHQFSSDDIIKNELFPRLLAEHKARMESTIQAFANYMVIQTLAVKDIEEKYAKKQEQKTPTLVPRQEGVNAPWQTK